MGYAFISYSTKNRDSAVKLRQLLIDNNIKPWIAPNDIPIGSKYPVAINRAIKECSCFILLLTKDAQESAWVPKEIERAINYTKPLITIKLDDVILNDEFEFYISTDQIVAAPCIDGSSEVIKDVIHQISLHTGFTEMDAPQYIDAEDEASDVSVSYTLPPLDLLDEGGADAESLEISKKISGVFLKAKVNAYVEKIERGPRITKFIIKAAPGTNIKRILSLHDDIVLELGIDSVRMEAPIPGKSILGIEIPNKNSERISFYKLLQDPEFKNAQSKTTVCLGQRTNGSNVYFDIAKMPHALIGGAVGMGKSIFLHTLIVSLLYKASPDDVKFILIDPTFAEFDIYNGIPHLQMPVVTNATRAIGAIEWAVEEMNRRYDILENTSSRNVDAYNEKVDANPAVGKRMPKIIIVIDELAELMLTMGDNAERLIMILAQKSRAAGIHLILGTQKPSHDVITGIIKANIPTRIALKVASPIDSRLIIDQSGAENLLARGDMLFASPSSLLPERIHGTFVSDAEINSIVEFLKSKTAEPYNQKVLDAVAKLTAKYRRATDPNSEDKVELLRHMLLDTVFTDAVDIGIRLGSLTCAFLQRKFALSYSKATQYLDAMQRLGIIGERRGSKGREVLISEESWHKMRFEHGNF